MFIRCLSRNIKVVPSCETWSNDPHEHMSFTVASTIPPFAWGHGKFCEASKHTSSAWNAKFVHYHCHIKNVRRSSATSVPRFQVLLKNFNLGKSEDQLSQMLPVAERW